MGQKNLNLAHRLGDILAKLNNGERLNIHNLAEEFGVTPRTIMRDLKDRLVFLDWKEQGPQYYSLSRSSLGQLYQEDIERFAHFASIQNLFPKIDRTFFQKQLTQSLCVKGISYEDISHKVTDFELIKVAIDVRQMIDFTYVKGNKKTRKNYKVEPYILLNRSGIWYLMASDGGQIKTFCFSQMDNISVLKDKFEVDQDVLDDIKSIDSIYYGNQIDKVTIEVNAKVAIYFIRRNVLPNQSIIESKENGDIVVISENVNEQEILALMRYWIPNVNIIKPIYLQDKLRKSLEEYLKPQ